MGGHGTGVLRAYNAIYLIRGLTIGIAAESSLFLARSLDLPQHYLVVARGFGTTVAPALLGHQLGVMMRTGESQTLVALALAAKMLCEVAITRVELSALIMLAWFGVGVGVAVLDTMGFMLITRVHGKDCSKAFTSYDMLYGVGCILAPFIVVYDYRRAWDFLAICDFLVFAAVAGKRGIRGKPTDWERKINGHTSGSSTPDSGAESPQGTRPQIALQVEPPARVVKTGMAFTFCVQATMTSVSCWSFTYAVKTLQLAPYTAARVPGAFYGACTLARLAMMPLSHTVPPAGLMHIGTLLTMTSAIIFYCLDSMVAAGADAAVLTPAFLFCFMVMGAGFCPHHSLMVAAMQQHGNLSPQQHGWYGTSTCLGITMGMWLPAYMSLPLMQVCGTAALLLILNSQLKDFPRALKLNRMTLVALNNQQ